MCLLYNNNADGSTKEAFAAWEPGKFCYGAVRAWCKSKAERVHMLLSRAGGTNVRNRKKKTKLRQ